MNVLARAASALRSRNVAQRVSPIGLDISLEYVHLVQLEMSGLASPVVRANVSMPIGMSRQDLLENPRRFRTLLRKALSGAGFLGRKAVMAVPSGMFKTLSINYRSGGRDRDGSAILQVMAQRLDGDLSRYVLDYLPVRNRSRNEEKLALVAVTERESVVRLLEATRKAGLQVQALEIGPVAIRRLIGALARSAGHENVLVINCGRQASYLTLVSGEDVLFDQSVSFGENELVTKLADTLEIDAVTARELVLGTGIERGAAAWAGRGDDPGLANTVVQIIKPQFLRLVDEIRRVCLYAAAETRGGSVARIYMLGSIARWPGAVRLLGSMMDIEISGIPNPLESFTRAGDPERLAVAEPGIAVATGLALRGMHDHG